jgi:hypothetical protein
MILPFSRPGFLAGFLAAACQRCQTCQTTPLEMLDSHLPIRPGLKILAQVKWLKFNNAVESFKVGYSDSAWFSPQFSRGDHGVGFLGENPHSSNSDLAAKDNCWYCMLKYEE